MLLGPAWHVEHRVKVEDPGDGMGFGESLSAGVAETKSSPNVIFNDCSPGCFCVLVIYQFHTKAWT